METHKQQKKPQTAKRTTGQVNMFLCKNKILNQL